MANLKVSIKDFNTLRLDEDGKIGDTIDLKSLHSVDDSFIMDAVNQKKDEVYNSLLSGFRTQSRLELENELSLQREKYTNEINALQSQKNQFNTELDNLKKLYEHEKTSSLEKLRNEFLIEKVNLTNQLNQLKDNFEVSKKNEVLQVQMTLESKFTQTLNLKEKEIIELKNNLNKKQLENEIDRSKESTKLKEEISNKEKEIELLTRERSNRNIKKIGENLENWSNEQFKNVSTFGFKTSSWEKDNLTVRTEGDLKGTKGDYIFKVFSDTGRATLLTSAMCEMKSEQLESENKKKNSDHFKKLNDDRNKKGLEYAILISELEYNVESDAPIYVVNEYEKMYVVRPHFFITLLGIIESIGMKYAHILIEHENEKIEFKESLEVIEQFEEFKTNLLNNAISNIDKKVSDIQTKANTIINSANSILENVRIIVDSHLNTLRNRIENFNIQRVVNKIDKLTD